MTFKVRSAGGRICGRLDENPDCHSETGGG